MSTPCVPYDAKEGTITVPDVLGHGRRAKTEHGGVLYQMVIPEDRLPGSKLQVALQDENSPGTPHSLTPPAQPRSWAGGGHGAKDERRVLRGNIFDDDNVDVDYMQEPSYVAGLEAELSVAKAELAARNSELKAARREVELMKELSKTKSELTARDSELRRILEERGKLLEAETAPVGPDIRAAADAKWEPQARHEPLMGPSTSSLRIAVPTSARDSVHNEMSPQPVLRRARSTLPSTMPARPNAQAAGTLPAGGSMSTLRLAAPPATCHQPRSTLGFTVLWKAPPATMHAAPPPLTQPLPPQPGFLQGSSMSSTCRHIRIPSPMHREYCHYSTYAPWQGLRGLSNFP